MPCMWRKTSAVAIGSALGGLVASYSFSFVFLANSLLYAAFLLIVTIGLLVGFAMLAAAAALLYDRWLPKSARETEEKTAATV
ncbi:hypothetical protein GsuE55_00200 [Geobacillus subterraneus]|uniref:Major facilitator superfamily (MFS) profile domain-containing protein n=1 Tax=Geobacillus subterraneus TaxID=129338 RepID=A0A679FLS8_9BACL|nr:hypothetical protein GsuE55_00200 [Geobacillus subterraneus]